MDFLSFFLFDFIGFFECRGFGVQKIFQNRLDAINRYGMGKDTEHVVRIGVGTAVTLIRGTRGWTPPFFSYTSTR